MYPSPNPIRFMVSKNGIDFRAPVPLDYLLFEYPSSHDPGNREEFFRLSPNWTVRVHKSESRSDQLIIPQKNFQLFHQGKEISILAASKHSDTEWQVFRRGDALFCFDRYTVVKDFVLARHTVHVPPWCVIDRFVQKFCPRHLR